VVGHKTATRWADVAVVLGKVVALGEAGVVVMAEAEAVVGLLPPDRDTFA